MRISESLRHHRYVVVTLSILSHAYFWTHDSVSARFVGALMSWMYFMPVAVLFCFWVQR